MQVGLWIVDLMHSGASANLGEDGVQLFKPHAQYVSGLQWMNSGTAPASLLTSSYDGSVVLMDVEAEQFRLVAVHADDEFSAMGVQGPELALLGDAQVRCMNVSLSVAVLVACKPWFSLNESRGSHCMQAADRFVR